MLNRDESRRLLSRPMGIRWAGWQTDTYSLQQAGWELAVNRDMYTDTYRLAMRHKAMSLYALTNRQYVDARVTDLHYHGPDLPIWNVMQIAPQIEVMRIQEMGWDNDWNAVDAQPQVAQSEITSLEDMNIFKVAMTRTEEIIVDKADMTVIEHLQAIKDLQAPKQTEIRDRMMKERARDQASSYTSLPEQEMVAQIIHFPGAA